MVLVMLSICTLATATIAKANSGKMLLDAHQSGDPEMEIAAEAFVTGIYSTLVALKVVCFTEAVVHDEITNYVFWYLREVPSILHIEGAYIVSGLLIENFPCTEEEEVCE